MNHRFKLTAPWYGEDGLSSPQFIFRVVSVTLGPVVNGEIEVNESGLEDPNVNDFFVVHSCVSDDCWVVEFRGLFFTAQWIQKPLGFKGSSFLDTGYFYAPYVPNLKPVVLDPDSFNKRSGLLSKYGKKLLQEGSKYYGTIAVEAGRMVVQVTDIERPSFTFEEIKQDDGTFVPGRSISHPVMFKSNMCPFDISGHHQAVVLDYSGEKWEFLDAVVSVAPMRSVDDGEFVLLSKSCKRL